jgi:hypothetical protein
MSFKTKWIIIIIIIIIINPFCFIFSLTFKRIKRVLDLVLVQKGLDITLLLIRWLLIHEFQT